MRRLSWVALVLAGVLGATLIAIHICYDPGDPRLRAYVRQQPRFAVVFTSRSEPASFRPAAARGDYSATGTGVNGLGEPQWQAREGRLRILTPRGVVRELTWGRPLPDGGTLIDVMSPSVSPDGETIVFAARRADAHGGRFRIYSVEPDGSNLKPLTGLSDDLGCTAVPPLRFDENGKQLSDASRRSIDFDDVDPTLFPNGILVFASSRNPDTGGRDRRATQIWLREPSGHFRAMTASRANDRWPVALIDRSFAFTIWGKQDEVVSADGTGLVRNDPKGLTNPADRWFAATLTPTGENFAELVKATAPVWRPRPLHNGSVVFMSTPQHAATPFTPDNEYPERNSLRVGQLPPGYVASSPSSLGTGAVLPAIDRPRLAWLNAVDSSGATLSVATPSPIDGGVLVSAAPVGPEGKPELLHYGLYFAPADDWPISPSETKTELTLLFDDPDFIDAEPVAIYERPIPGGALPPPPPIAEKSIALANGSTYRGPTGHLEGRQLTEFAMGTFPGQTALGGAVVYPHFPQNSLHKVAFYIAHRDRFDDPIQPIIRGKLEKLLEVPVVKNGPSAMIEATLPIGSPTLLVGLGPDGKVATVPVPGSNGSYYAFAGDHVSGMRPGGYTFCTGCHTGHTFTGNNIAERRK